MSESAYGSDEIQRGVEALLSVRVIEPPTRIPRGFGNENWRVRCQDQELIIKLAPVGGSIKKLTAAAGAHRLAVASGAPVPAEMFFDPECAAFDGRVVRAYQYVRAWHPPEILTSEPARRRFFTSLGKAVAQLHTVKCDGFSSRIGDPVAFPTWADYIGYRLPQIVGRIRATDAFTEAETSSMVERLSAAAARVSPVVEPRLTHRDLYIDNILAAADGQVAAIIDFDHAEAWDPIADLAKPRWMIFPQYVGAGEAFLAGYLGEAGDVPMLEERVWVAEVLEQMNNVPNSITAGATEHGESARRRLAEVLATPS